jgi:hypothetical protein
LQLEDSLRKSSTNERQLAAHIKYLEKMLKTQSKEEKLAAKLSMHHHVAELRNFTFGPFQAAVVSEMPGTFLIRPRLCLVSDIYWAK